MRLFNIIGNKRVLTQTCNTTVTKIKAFRSSQTSTHTNLQYDRYKDTKQVLKAFRSSQEKRLQSHLVSQGSFLSAAISIPKLNSTWSSVQSHLSKTIFNYAIRYINITLPIRKYLSKWGLATSSHFAKIQNFFYML